MYDFIGTGYPTPEQQSAIQTLERLAPTLEKHIIGSTEYLSVVAEFSKAATDLAGTHRCWNEERGNIDDDEYEYHLAEGAKAPVVPESEWSKAETTIYVFFIYFKLAQLEAPKQETLSQALAFANAIKTMTDYLYVLRVWHPDYDGESEKIRTYYV